MSYPYSSDTRLATGQINSSLTSRQTAPVPVADKVAQPAPLTRRYEISYLCEDGSFESCTRLAPAIPEFEEAFSAFARGTVIATAEGPVAVEDLVPGMEVLTGEGRAERITWIGSMTLFPPRAMPGLQDATLTRIAAEAFGIGRPMPDLVLGPRARILVRDARTRFATGTDSAYGPARSFIDGVSVIEVTPVAPIPVYHLVLERQGSIRAAGMEIESYHPGGRMLDGFDPQVTQIFMSLFPHMRSIGDFGHLSHPRITAMDIDRALNG